MIYLIYGQNAAFVRNFLKNQVINSKTDTKEYELQQDEDIGLLEQTLQTNMFGVTPLNIVNVTKASKDLIDKLMLLLKTYPLAKVAIISYKDLESSDSLVLAVKSLRGKVVNISSFRHKEIFDYLDSLFSLETKSCQKNLQKLLLYDNDPVYILTMLQYQLRNIALAKFGVESKLKNWQLYSVKKQAKNFSNEQIISLYELLYNYDVGLKSGNITPEVLVSIISKQILSMKT